MLGNADVIATCAVRDIERAKKFHGAQSQYDGTNKATAATWAVSDLESTVQALRAKGVRFEHGNILAVVSG